MVVFSGCGRVNFGSKYLEFCWDFIQHICTHSKGFLVSFSTMCLAFRSDLKFLKFSLKCRKNREKSHKFDYPGPAKKYPKNPRVSTSKIGPLKVLHYNKKIYSCSSC
jgi:hypothetical protein